MNEHTLVAEGKERNTSLFFYHSAGRIQFSSTSASPSSPENLVLIISAPNSVPTLADAAIISGLLDSGVDSWFIY
jgi:hypothetical protein